MNKHTPIESIDASHRDVLLLGASAMVFAATPSLAFSAKRLSPTNFTALLSVKVLKKGSLKVYESFPRGMCTTHADTIDPDLLAFIKN